MLYGVLKSSDMTSMNVEVRVVSNIPGGSLLRDFACLPKDRRTLDYISCKLYTPSQPPPFSAHFLMWHHCHVLLLSVLKTYFGHPFKSHIGLLPPSLLMSCVVRDLCLVEQDHLDSGVVLARWSGEHLHHPLTQGKELLVLNQQSWE